MRKAALVLLLAAGQILAIGLSSGCNSTPMHIGTVASAGAQSALVVTSSAEQEAFDHGLIAPEQHLANVKKLKAAVSLHEDAAKMLLATPEAGSPPAAYYALGAQALAMLQDVIELLPATASKTQAAELVKKGLF